MPIQKTPSFIKACVLATRRFHEEKYTYRAAALAFTTIIAIVPLLLVIVFVVTVFPASGGMISLGENYILQNFVPAAASAIEYYFQGFIQQAVHLPALSIFFLFITTVILIHTIEETLNDIWHVPRRRRGKKLAALFFYWLLFLLMPFMIGWSVFLSSYVFLLTWMVGHASKFGIYRLLLSLAPIAINTLIFGMLFTIVPNAKVYWREGMLGGFIAAVLFDVSRLGFAFYITQFPLYALIYGAFAVIPIFLLWLYIFWFIIIFSALIVNAKQFHPNSSPLPQASEEVP